MRNSLPASPHKNELGIINLDTSKGAGTHWVSYIKHNKNVEYFDGYGNLQPPLEVKKYFSKCFIQYNDDNFQGGNLFNCGHLCVKFLFNKLK